MTQSTRYNSRQHGAVLSGTVLPGLNQRKGFSIEKFSFNELRTKISKLTVNSQVTENYYSPAKIKILTFQVKIRTLNRLYELRAHYPIVSNNYVLELS